MVGPASSRPRPPGGPRAPKSVMAWLTRTPSPRDIPLPNDSSGQVGTAQPEYPRSSHQSPTVRSGFQFSSSQAVTSVVTSSLVRRAVSVIPTSPAKLDRAVKFGWTWSNELAGAARVDDRPSDGEREKSLSSTWLSRKVVE